MTAKEQDSWAEIDRLLDSVLDLEPVARPGFLARIRSDDPELGIRLERLLRAITSSEAFLQDPAATYAAPLVRSFFQADELKPGMQLGAYELISELGQGGTATVYLARDLRHGRRVAIKVPHPELAAAVGPEHFHREIRIAAQLQHPNILPLHDSGDANGVLYYVMPYVEGESLRKRLHRERQLPVDEAVRLTCEVADALGSAHAQGLVHCDIKPENILLSGGHALVADFGIARAIAAAGGDGTEAARAVGTPAYMSPEQAAGAQLDGRSDIYSLGCVLYEMLAGDPPFVGSSAREVLHRKTVDAVPILRTVRANVPQTIELAVDQALARMPADRFETAGEFAAALREPAKLPGSRRWLVAGGLLAMVVFGLTWISSALLERGADQRSVAVLPCESAGPDSTRGYIADRWSEELIDKLSKVAGLRVISWVSMRQYHQTSKSPTQIGRELSAATLVRCGVAETPDSVALKVQVIDATQGRLLESRAYVRLLTASGINGVQTDAAASIAQALGVTPSSGEQNRLERASTRNTEALKAFRRGRYFFGLLELQQSIAEFKEAIARDSAFAAAYAGLADAISIQGAQGARPTREYVPQVVQLVLRALRIDPDLAEAHTLLGDYLFWYNHDWASAEPEHQRALELNPNSATAHMWYGMDLVTVGRHQRGVAELEKAVALDPAFPLARIQLISGLRAAGLYQRAMTEVQAAFKIDPENPVVYLHLGLIHLQQGRADSAVAALEKGVRLGANDADARSRLANAYAAAGRPAEAKRILSDLLADPGVDPLHVSRIELGLGNRDEALSWLQRAYDARSWDLMTALGGQDPAFHVLRGDPRFLRLKKQAGLKL